MFMNPLNETNLKKTIQLTPYYDDISALIVCTTIILYTKRYVTKTVRFFQFRKNIKIKINQTNKIH